MHVILKGGPSEEKYILVMHAADCLGNLGLQSPEANGEKDNHGYAPTTIALP